MDELIKTIITLFIGGTIPVVLVVILVALNPEKVEIWLSILFKILSNIIKFIKGFRKSYIKYDLQGRVNSFIKDISNKVPSLSPYKMKLEWIKTSTITRKAFLDGNRVVMRLKEDDPHDENFINSVCFYVSSCLLVPIKRHINQTQKSTIDTFVTTEIIKKEKPQVFDYFADEYLHETIKTPESIKYFSDYQLINEHGLFFEVLLQELDYLGRKIMNTASKNLLVKEFDEIIRFLRNTSNRKTGDETDLYYQGQFSKLLIIIIGKAQKISNTKVYDDYLVAEINRRPIETIYGIGPVQNKEAIDEVFSNLNRGYELYHTGVSEAILTRSNGEKANVTQYFSILRKIERTAIV